MTTAAGHFLTGARQAVPIASAIASSILFRPDRVTIGLIELDATLNETHTIESTVTDHPVEVGADISDHIRAEPRQLELNGVVSNTPIAFFASIRERKEPSRSINAYKALRDLADKGQLVNVHTTLNDYFNMAITSIRVTRDASSGQVVNMSISLREVFLAETKRVDALQATSVEKKGRKAKDKSRDNKQELSKKPTAPSKSILKSLSDNAFADMKSFAAKFNPFGSVPGAS